MTGFFGFCLVLALVLVPAGWCMVRLRNTALFAGMILTFLPLLGAANEMTYNAWSFFNSVVGIVGGTIIAAIVCRLVPPVPPALRVRRLVVSHIARSAPAGGKAGAEPRGLGAACVSTAFTCCRTRRNRSSARSCSWLWPWERRSSGCAALHLALVCNRNWAPRLPPLSGANPRELWTLWRRSTGASGRWRPDIRRPGYRSRRGPAFWRFPKR